MQTIVKVNETELEEVFRSYVERRLRFAFSRFGNRVGQVIVRISGGGREEHRCRITAELVPFGRVEVEETDTDLFAAIDRATGRIGRLFGRELERRRETRANRDSVRLVA